MLRLMLRWDMLVWHISVDNAGFGSKVRKKQSFFGGALRQMESVERANIRHSWLQLKLHDKKGLETTLKTIPSEVDRFVHVGYQFNAESMWSCVVCACHYVETGCTCVVCACHFADGLVLSVSSMHLWPLYELRCYKTSKKVSVLM